MGDTSDPTLRQLLGRFAPEGILALGVFLTLLAYVPALSAPFVFDDHNDLLNHDALHHLWPPAWFWSSRRPFVVFTFALNWALTPGEPFFFRLCNLAIHTTSGLFAYLLALEVLPVFRPTDPTPRRRLFAALAATLWLVHPLHTSAVTYVVHRYESLAGLLSLATLTFFLRAKREPEKRWLPLALVSALLASVSKETTMTLVPLALVLDSGWPRRRAGNFFSTLTATLRARKVAYAGLLLAFVPLALLLGIVPSGATQKFDATDFGPLDYLRSEPRALAHYARLLVWPWPLTIDYYDFPVARSLGEIPFVGWCALGAVGSAFVGLVLGRPGALAPVLALICLAPTSTIVPLRYELVAERRLYLAIFPLILAGVTLASRLADAPGRRRFGATFYGLLLFGATGTTLVRNADYLDRLGLYAREVAHRPNNARARAWFAQYLADAGELEAAHAQLVLAERLDPEVPFLERQRARVADLLGRADEAARYAEETLRRHPDDDASLAVVALFYPKAGRSAELLELLTKRAERGTLPSLAWLALANALSTVPEARDGARSLALLDGVFGRESRAPELDEARAFAWAALGRFDEARRLWSPARSERSALVRDRVSEKLARGLPVDAADLAEPRARP